ncbi:head GIN domain-containing protein [uncultured Muriicola sp.]|uniref:head GIN domain-containing protein n=1 Tax=uncultured Muriicola sp. TaxID=1583102 RepID=UPI002627D545|nr:head GIN domain-containing protein [uncultured Muriicola sp.]
MNKLTFITFFGFFALLITGCNGDNVPDCFQNAGDLVREEVSLPNFEKITVFENIELVLSEGLVQEVVIETGEFLRSEVTAEVEGGRLVVRNTNNCNLFREYGITKIFVTSPNINEIRSSTGWPVRSEGTLTFPELQLISESFSNTESETTDGSFDLDLATQNLTLVANGIAYFKLRGSTQRFNANIWAGDSRIEAEELIVQEMIINHRGSNDMLVNPQLILRGVIRGTGDVLSFNRPDSVAVEELYRGRLIFKE